MSGIKLKTRNEVKPQELKFIDSGNFSSFSVLCGKANSENFLTECPTMKKIIKNGGWIDSWQCVTDKINNKRVREVFVTVNQDSLSNTVYQCSKCGACR